MALVTCYECNRQLSSAAAACPHCGAPSNRVAPAAESVQQAVTPGEAVAQSEPSGGGVLSVLKWGAGLFVVAWMLSLCTGKSGSDGGPTPVATANQGLTHSYALTVCQMAMKKIARDPDKAEIPYVKGSEDSGFFYFAWGADTKHMRMRNGLGLEVPASGTCYVDKVQKRITQLTLNGQQVI